MEDILQITPARCKGGVKMPKLQYIDGEYRATKTARRDLVSEEKIDGHRALFHFAVDGGPRLTSRRISKKTGQFKENGDNFPRLCQVANEFMEMAEREGIEFGYTVLDGEVVVPGKPFEAVQSFMGALPEKAAKSEEQQEAVFMAFDVLWLDGEDVRDLSWNYRRTVLDGLIKQMNYFAADKDALKHVPAVVSNNIKSHRERFLEVIANGGEGLVIKDPQEPYGEGWQKWKKEATYDVVITGLDPGEGKFSRMFGALRFGAFKNGKLVELGRCSGFADGDCDWRLQDTEEICAPNADGGVLIPRDVEQPVGTRAWFWANKNALAGNQVIEVKCNGLTKHGNLRHPQFLRVRTDKPMEDCTVEAIRRDSK